MNAEVDYGPVIIGTVGFIVGLLFLGGFIELITWIIN